MPSRGKSICRKSGCNVLLSNPGYCDSHQREENKFELLDAKKTDQTKKFYSSYAWTKKSKQIRREQPLCQECLRKDIPLIRKSELVHHTPELTELLSKGLNPLDKQYLEAICEKCHLGHLRAKKKSK